MLMLPPTVKVFLCTTPVDLRKSHDGLSGIVRQVLIQNPMNGHLFVFVNKRRDRLKALYWDRTGWMLWYKRLERGTFSFPREVPDGEVEIEVEAAELCLMLEGIELGNARRRVRWRPEEVRLDLPLPT